MKLLPLTGLAAILLALGCGGDPAVHCPADKREAPESALRSPMPDEFVR